MAFSVVGLTPQDTERYIFLLLESARKQDAYKAVVDYRDYYSGKHPVYLTHRQEEYLGDLLTGTEHIPAHNLCGTVVDVLRERIVVEGFTGEDAAGEALAEWAWQLWQWSEMDKGQISLVRRALRDGHSYIILAWDEANKRPRWHVNRAYDGVTGVTFYRDPESDEAQIACKYWERVDLLGKEHRQARRTVYLPDRILRQKADAKGEYGWSDIDKAEGPAVSPWVEPMPSASNPDAGGRKPLGVGVIEFANPGGVSEIEGIIGLQNGLNKTWLDLFAAADSAGFPLLTIEYPGPNNEPAATDDEDETAGDLQIAPGRATELFDGAKMQRLDSGDMGQLVNVITTVTGAIAGVSRTPQYYLRPFGGSEVPSGEALKQLEAALISRAEERQTLFGASYVEAVRMAAKLARAMGYDAPDPEAQISVNWKSASTRNELYDADVATREKALDVPVEILWEKRLGYSPSEVEQFKRLRAQAAASQLANVLTAMAGGNSAQPGSRAAGQPNSNQQPQAPATGLNRGEPNA